MNQFNDQFFQNSISENEISKFQSIAADRATTMGHIKLSHLKEALITFPSKNELDDISSNFKIIFEQILNNLIENQSLTKTRDTLLPKLISGEIELKQADASVNSATENSIKN